MNLTPVSPVSPVSPSTLDAKYAKGSTTSHPFSILDALSL